MNSCFIEIYLIVVTIINEVCSVKGKPFGISLNSNNLIPKRYPCNEYSKI